MVVNGPLQAFPLCPQRPGSRKLTGLLGTDALQTTQAVGSRESQKKTPQKPPAGRKRGSDSSDDDGERKKGACCVVQ